MITMVFHLCLALWVAGALVVTAMVCHETRGIRPFEPPRRAPETVVIVPVRGAGRHLAEFFARLRAQAYHAARIVVVVEAESDPAAAVARAAAVGRGLPLEVRVAGLSEGTGQKIWNLLSALETLQPADRIVVFADADTLVGPHWLERLVAPIIKGRAEVTTGFRWMVPYGSGGGSDLVAAVDHAIATALRWRRWNTVWGGTVAIRRDVLHRLEIERWWTGAVIDDAQMIRALWAQKRVVVCPAGLFVPSPIDMTLRAALEYGRRQYLIVRVHLSRFWWIAASLVVCSLSACGLALALALRSDAFAIAALAATFVLMQLRFVLRDRMGRRIAAECDVTVPTARPATLWLASFLAPFFNAACLIAACSSRRMRWGGVDYEMLGPQAIRMRRL